MSLQPPDCKTVEDWIKGYPDLQFDGTTLRCKLCETIISWNTKNDIEQHVQSEKHTACAAFTTTTSESQKQFNCDILKMMLVSNIPIHKLANADLRQFLQNCANGKYGDVVVPSESTLRKGCLPTVYNEVKEKIISELNDKKIWISVTETTISTIILHGRNINVFVGGMDETRPMPARLLSSTVVEVVNADKVYECMDRSLKMLWGKNYENNKGRVLLLVTDTTPYMEAAGMRFRETYCNALHVTCLAHALNSVAETIRSCYPNVDKLIVNVNKIFLKAPARINVFKEILPGVSVPPEPDITRWGTWLEATSYYYIHFDGIKNVMQQLDFNDSASISIARRLFDDPNLREDLKYLHLNFSRLPSVVSSLGMNESNYSLKNAVDSVLELRQIIHQLSGSASERVKKKFDTVLENNPGFKTLCSIVDLFDLKQVNFSEPTINGPSLKYFSYFKCAPVTTMDVEWSLTKQQKNLKPVHLEQLLVIKYNSSSSFNSN